MHKIVGVECGFPLKSGNRRIDELEKTQHYTYFASDLLKAKGLGIDRLHSVAPHQQYQLGAFKKHDTPDNAGLYAIVKNDQDQWERSETPLVARFRRFLAEVQAS